MYKSQLISFWYSNRDYSSHFPIATYYIVYFSFQFVIIKRSVFQVDISFDWDCLFTAVLFCDEKHPNAAN